MAALVLGGCLGGGGEDPRSGTAQRPNLIVVMTDDQTLGSFNDEVMPLTRRLFARDGTVFENAFASPPLCCPARAGFLTGQYPHNHGVDANAPGYPLLRDPANSLPAWLQEAGYRTAFVGKYLNGYEFVGGAKPAPGWDEWFAAAGYPAYFDYEVSDNGESRRYGGDPSDYSTRVFTDRAIDLFPSEEPAFLWLALNAPHVTEGAAPPCGPGYFAQPPDAAAFSRWADESLPRGPAFDERDTSDKPSFLRKKAPVSADEIKLMTQRWRCALAAMAATDRELARLVRALRQAGEWDETVLVYVSDNGYFFGEHRMEDDKRLPYDPALRIPLAVRPPSDPATGEAPEASDAVASTVDLAPTLLDYAGARPCSDGECRRLDGISLRPALEGAELGPDDRAVLVELDDGYTYEALRTSRYLYAELRADRSGPLPEPEIELYDVRADPHQLENLWRRDPSGVAELQDRLAARLDALRECTGSGCS